MGRYAVGTDVGGSHLRSAVIDLDTKIICSDSVLTPMDSNADAEEILSSFGKNLSEVVERNLEYNITQFGFAFPGPFDYKKGISHIYGVQKYESIFGVNMIESLRARLNYCNPSLLEFKFINDASAFALGECFCGCAKGAGRVMALTLGTGVGSGFVAGNILDVSSEFVPANGEVWCLPFEGTIADNCFSTRWIVRRYAQISGVEVSGAREVADKYESDPAARQLFDEYGRRLAEFASPLISKFNAGTLVLGGNISRAYSLFSASMKSSMPTGVEVRISSLRDSAGIIGAASLFNE